MEAYKYYSRLDDVITLVTGEKVNPLPIEGHVRQNRMVREAVVFGSSREQIGLLLFPSLSGAKLPCDALIDSIYPSLEDAQNTMPAYARLSRDMIRVMPLSAEFASTQKGTIIRQTVYRQYSSVIESMYEDYRTVNGHTLLGKEMQDLIEQLVRAVLPGDMVSVDPDANFFELGMDSSRAIQLRKAISSQINLNGERLELNIIFDFPSVRALSAKLEALAAGTEGNQVSSVQAMAALVSQFGQFSSDAMAATRREEPHKEAGRHYVLLTGATGSLGAHIASILALEPQVSTIYCLVRASNPQHARQRVLQSLHDRRVFSLLNTSQVNKIVAWAGDLSRPQLGLAEDQYYVLRDHITTLIHAAWNVNFNLSLSTFKQTCIPQTRRLIDLCLTSARGAAFNFCSSVSAASAAGTAIPSSQYAVIPEALPESFDDAEATGYAQAKLVAEHITLRGAAETGLTARVLRIGQACGDTAYGIWNPTEAIPLMLHAGRKMAMLPELNEQMRWLPVDVVAGTVVELSLPASVPTGVYNIVNPEKLCWTKDLLPLLKSAALNFDVVSPAVWSTRLQALDPDPAVNPAYKLVQYLVKRCGMVESAEKREEWETENARKYSECLRKPHHVDAELVEKMVRYWTENCWRL